jgi:hypothetical protein
LRQRIKGGQSVSLKKTSMRLSSLSQIPPSLSTKLRQKDSTTARIETSSSMDVDRDFTVSTRSAIQAQPRGSRPIAGFIERNGAMYPLSLKSVRPG